MCGFLNVLNHVTSSVILLSKGFHWKVILVFKQEHIYYCKCHSHYTRVGPFTPCCICASLAIKIHSGCLLRECPNLWKLHTTFFNATLTHSAHTKTKTSHWSPDAGLPSEGGVRHSHHKKPWAQRVNSTGRRETWQERWNEDGKGD